MATESKKEIAKKPAAKKVVAKKPAPAKKPVVKAAHPKAEKKPVEEAELSPMAEAAMETSAITFEKPTIAKGRYIFATGRRKTAIANVRLFAGSEDNIINKKKLEVFFSQPGMANK